jgi:hypothetical protein
VASGEAGTVQRAHECLLGKGVWREGVLLQPHLEDGVENTGRLRSAPCPPLKRKCTAPLGREPLVRYASQTFRAPLNFYGSFVSFPSVIPLTTLLYPEPSGFHTSTVPVSRHINVIVPFDAMNQYADSSAWPIQRCPGCGAVFVYRTVPLECTR